MAARKTTIGISAAEFASKVKSKTTGPVSVIIEENKLAVENLFSLVKKELIESGTEDFCFELMHADSDSVTGGSIVGAAETVSMMSGFRVVWVKYADELTSSDLDTISEYIERAIAQNISDVLLVLVFSYFDKRTKFSKFVISKNIVVECKAESIKNVSFYVQKQYGKSITQGAVDLIKKLAGDDALAMKNELDKVCVYLGDTEQITEQHIAEICMESVAKNEWELTNYVLNGDTASVFKFLAELEKSGLDEMYRHAIISSTVLKLKQAKDAARSGTIYKNFYMYPNPNRVVKHVNSFSEEQMKDLLSWLMYSEIGAKGGNLPVKILGDVTCLKASGGIKKEKAKQVENKAINLNSFFD